MKLKKDTAAIYTAINEVCIRWLHENFYLERWEDESSVVGGWIFSGRGISGGCMSKCLARQGSVPPHPPYATE